LLCFLLLLTIDLVGADYKAFWCSPDKVKGITRDEGQHGARSRLQHPVLVWIYDVSKRDSVTILAAGNRYLDDVP